MSKTIIIRQDDNGDLVADVLMEGYNIIEETIYDASDKLQALLDHINDK